MKTNNEIRKMKIKKQRKAKNRKLVSTEKNAFYQLKKIQTLKKNAYGNLKKMSKSVCERLSESKIE